MREDMCNRAIAVIVAFGVLAGCAGGPRTPIGNVGMSLQDGRVSAAVRSALLNDPELGLRQIAIESRSGVVTLTGRVQTQEETQRAERLARGVEGVREVRVELRIEP
jgi:hyperosmotically inducible protein